MKGFQLEFFVQQDLFHHGKHLSDWLIELARTHGVRSATVFMGAAGLGQDRRIHATQMFDLIDHPVQVTMIVSEKECDQLFASLVKENLHLFYVKLAVEFGKVA